jgi:BNR repeat-like domain
VRLRLSAATFAVLGAAVLVVLAGSASAASPQTYDINTLAGKVASLYGTAGLQIRFSAFIEEEAEQEEAAPPGAPPITPAFVLSSPLDGNTVLPPNVTANQDTAAAPQNETSIAVDPNNPNRIVGGANDYVSRTWACTVSGTPCSALGEAASGTYFSNDGGSTWCCTSTDPQHLGTIIPGINKLTGGQYDAGGDPSVAFDSHGHVYYAGLGFDRTSPPNTVAVNKGTFSGANLSWSQPTFINQTTSPSTLNDKEWIAVDSHTGSPFQDRIYVTWTRFLFNAHNGNYIQSPIAFVSSSDGGATFTTPKLISGNVLYGQGSRPVVGPDGTLYVFWSGSTRLASLNSTYMVKSSDGGATWSKPVSISSVNNSHLLANTAFRNNSYPAAAAAPNGDLYATWTTQTSNGSVAVYSKSTNGGSSWSNPTPVFPAATRTPIGYPVSQPSGGMLNAPSPAGAVEDIFPAAGVGPNGRVYLGAYRGDVVSPWQTCAAGPPPPEGRINCTTLGDYIHNTRLDYVVRDVTTGVTQTVSTHPINTRNGFGGGFFGDYTDLAVGSDNTFHAFWTDSNNKQSVVWFYGFQFVPTPINQEDVVTGSGSY